MRASHIKPWAKCETDAERLDVYNGLLLAAHLDAAFDAGLITFDDNGVITFHLILGKGTVTPLVLMTEIALQRVTGTHLANLAWHRAFLFGGKAG